MGAIGVRELKEHTSQVLRRVRQRGEEIDVTHHGRVIARLVPVQRERPRPRASGAAWSSLDQLAREIGAHWPKGHSAAKAVRDERRKL
jgi:prevent-host-death family protein